MSCGTIAGMHGWHEWQRGEHIISTDQRRLDVPLIHAFLTGSYWAAGVPLEVVERSLEHSLAFGLYRGAEQIGFARVVTDRATFAYLADVFVLDGHRGHGLGKRLMKLMIDDGPGADMRWVLFTADAHGLYESFGFAKPDETAMVRPARQGT